MGIINAEDYFDVSQHRKRLGRDERVWEAFFEGNGKLVPVVLNVCASFFIDLFGVNFREYYTDLEVMAETQLKAIAWHLENLDDDEIPSGVFLDQGTLHEAIVFNAEIAYLEDSPPWGRPIIEDINDVNQLEIPDFSNHKGLLETKEKIRELKNMVKGVPVRCSVHLHAPYTMAAQLIGPERLYIHSCESPDLVIKLLEICLKTYEEFKKNEWRYDISAEVMDDLIVWRKSQRGLKRIWVSDDNAALVSPALYQKYVLPYNKRLFAQYEYVHLHMDGNWTHLIPLVSEYRCDFIEVGAETDLEKAIEVLAKHSVLQGGITGELAREGTPEECAREAEKCIEQTAGGAKYVLAVAGEAWPQTPLVNLQAIVDVANRCSSYKQRVREGRAWQG